MSKNRKNYYRGTLRYKKNPKGNRLKYQQSFECFLHANSEYDVICCEYCKYVICPLCHVKCPHCQHIIKKHPVLGKFGEIKVGPYWSEEQLNEECD